MPKAELTEARSCIGSVCLTQPNPKFSGAHPTQPNTQRNFFQATQPNPRITCLHVCNFRTKRIISVSKSIINCFLKKSSPIKARKRLTTDNWLLLSIQRSLAELPKTWVVLGRLAEPNPTQPNPKTSLGWVGSRGWGPMQDLGQRCIVPVTPVCYERPVFDDVYASTRVNTNVRCCARIYECTLLRAYI